MMELRKVIQRRYTSHLIPVTVAVWNSWAFNSDYEFPVGSLYNEVW